MDSDDIFDLSFDSSTVDEYRYDYVNNVAPGVRFRPNDELLISSYLKPKLFNQPLPRNVIIEANIYQCNPKILTKLYKKKGHDRLYFFTPRQRKYPNGDRPNRSTGDGYWKATGADKTIKDTRNTVIGFKKSLVFYEGKAPGGRKSHWIMHEYRVNDAPRRKRTSADDMRLDDNVLCMIYYKGTKKPKAKTITDTDKDPLSTSHDDLPIVGSTTSLDHLIPSTSNLTSVESTPSHGIDNHHPFLHPIDDLDMQQPLQNAEFYSSLEFLDMPCEEVFSMDNSNDEFVEKVLNDEPTDDDLGGQTD